MDFDDTPEEAAFRAEARAWLSQHATAITAGTPRRSPWGGIDEAEHVKACKQWERTLYDGGWAGITWPKAYGGRAASAIEAAIFNQEQAKFDVSAGVFAVGIGMVGPTLIAHGTPEQKERYLDRMLRGEEVWCQLFSEPGAGSDLAGLGTRAVRDGDEWVVNGQKVWNSGAHFSDLGILLARTDPTQPKHRGITYFLVDMKTPGIDVRPLRELTGLAMFNEVFFTDVFVPDDDVVGPVDGGWKVARATLGNESVSIGGGQGGMAVSASAFIAPLDAHPERLAGGEARVGRHVARSQAIELLNMRSAHRAVAGGEPGPEGAITKLVLSENGHEAAAILTALGGADSALMDGAGAMTGFLVLMHRGMSIAGGTSEIKRNQIGERLLGLPRDPLIN
jgi:hypothetical protein